MRILAGRMLLLLLPTRKRKADLEVDVSEEDVCIPASDPAPIWKGQTREEAWAEAIRLGEWADSVVDTQRQPGVSIEDE